TITVAVTGGALKEGDAFTITGVESVHQITKQATGQLKTFRIVKVNSPTSVVISPPIISAQGGSEAEKQYQNVSATPANGAVITMLNTATAFANPFWHRDAIELIP
ncbi:P22 phage major capsid protein family protein, partial [Acinetobacter baumannii]